MYRHTLVFGAACVGMLLFGMVFLSLGTIAVYIQEQYQESAMRVASLASSLPLGILLGSLFFGPIVDRFSYKPLLVASAGLVLVAFELTAYTRSFRVLQFAYFLIGFAGGVINGSTNALAADITAEGKGAKLSLLGVFFGIGALGMPLLIGAFSRYYSYRVIISGIGWFVLLPMVYFILVKFPDAKQKQGFPVRRAISLVREPVLILLGLFLFFESALEGMVNNWTTLFLKSASLSEPEALYALSGQLAAMAITRLVLSRLLRQVPSRIVIYTSLILILAGTALLAFASSFCLALASMIFLGIGFAAGFPVILGYVGELYSEISGTAFSLVTVLALTGNTLLNYLTGILVKSRGITGFPLMLAICVILMAVLFTLTYRKISLKIN